MKKAVMMIRLYWDAFKGYYFPSRRAGLNIIAAILNAIELAYKIGK